MSYNDRVAYHAYDLLLGSLDGDIGPAAQRLAEGDVDSVHVAGFLVGMFNERMSGASEESASAWRADVESELQSAEAVADANIPDTPADL